MFKKKECKTRTSTTRDFIGRDIMMAVDTVREGCTDFVNQSRHTGISGQAAMARGLGDARARADKFGKTVRSKMPW